MTSTPFLSQAWLLSGLTGSEEGELGLVDGRFYFVTYDGQQRFDVPLSEVRGVEFPWYYFGGGMKVDVGGTGYRFSFLRPGNQGGRIGEISPGRQIGKEWKAILASRA